MLSYTTLLVACLIALVIAALVYKTIALIVKSVANFRKSVNNIHEHVVIVRKPRVRQKAGTRRNAVDDSLSALDRRKQETAWNQSRINRAKPYLNHNRNFEWLQREQKTALAEKSYKVSRRVAPKPTTLAMVSKPFKRKVAPWVLEHRNRDKGLLANVETKLPPTST